MHYYTRVCRSLAVAALFIVFVSCQRSLNKSDVDYDPLKITLKSARVHGGEYVWKMKKVSELQEKGETISSSGFSDEDWLEAVIPGTALTSLVSNKVYPEPYYGQNNKRSKGLIPDIADKGREFYHYWYRTSFELPGGYEDKDIWLQTDGINYISEIWLNGVKIGGTEGMFLQKQFNITDEVRLGGGNVLAISVEPLKYPGDIQQRIKEDVVVNENRNGGDGNIGKNTTMLMSAGWDFTFHDGIRDRNTGIWRDIKILSSGPVTIEDPFIKSNLSLPDLTKSDQEIHLTLVNHTTSAKEVDLRLKIEKAGLAISKTLTLQPNESRLVKLGPGEFPELAFQNPELWWPINKGPQNLYHAEFAVEVGGEVSDTEATRFGIRHISSNRNSPDSSRVFYVNGKRLFVRGSNWIPEAMLRTSKERTLAELKYTQQAGINMLRLWGGGISESDEFFDLCDEMGILVWHEFWMTGDTKPPEDTTVYFNNVRSTIKRIRNHPSLAYYVSSNEQDDILDIKPILSALDGTRGYQYQSECCGVHDGSPYKYENPMQYYDNTASERGSRIDGFCPEYGTACLPVIESLRDMMPESDLWPIDKSTWDYLDGDGFHYMTSKYTTAVNQYGTPNNIVDYSWKGQMVGAVAYRSIWENWNYNKFDHGDRFASGVLFWYHNSPVKQVCSRMWDWSLEPTAALYFTQDALEPLHAQYDFIKNTVSVSNDLLESFDGLTVRFRLLDMKMNTLINESVNFSISSDEVVNDIMKINVPDDVSPVHFIKLEIFQDGELLSDTFYWRSTDEYKGPWTVGGPIHGGFERINELPNTALDVSLDKLTNADGKTSLTVLLTNNKGSLAFFTRLKITNNDKLVRPTFYSDNYISLLPGESKAIKVEFDTQSNPRLVVEGFNVERNEIEL